MALSSSAPSFRDHTLRNQTGYGEEIRISCNDLMQIVAEMEEALPLYSIVEDPAEVVRHNLDAAAQRCNNGEDPVALDASLTNQRPISRIDCGRAPRFAPPTRRWSTAPQRSAGAPRAPGSAAAIVIAPEHDLQLQGRVSGPAAGRPRIARTPSAVLSSSARLATTACTDPVSRLGRGASSV
jgi:hypothetical protein